MKILLCHNRYRQPGGERRAVEQQAAVLTRHGHQVLRYERDNREIDRLGPLARLRLPFGTLYSQRTVRDIRTLIERHRPDVAHVHNVFPLISPSLYLTLAEAGVPIVQTLHNYRFLCPNGLFYTHGTVCERCKQGNTLHAVRLRCYRGSRTASAVLAASLGIHRQRGTFATIDRFLALTDFVAEKMVESGFVDQAHITVLPPFLPGPLPEILPPDETEPYALFLGRLAPEKGADLVLEAFADLPDHRLVVAGTGPDEVRVRRLVREEKLDNVRLVGHVTGEARARLLGRATLTVVPSRCYETLSLTTLESLAAGVPVVASGHGALRSVLGGERGGLLFPPGDVAALRSCVCTLLENRELRDRLARRGRRHVEEELAEETAYQALLRVYREVRR